MLAHLLVVGALLRPQGVAVRGAIRPAGRPRMAPCLSSAAPPRLFRLAGITVPYDEAFGEGPRLDGAPPEPWWKDQSYAGVGEALRVAIAAKLGIDPEPLTAPGAVTVVRRSLDARKGTRAGVGARDDDKRPRYAYIVDLALPRSLQVRRSDQLTPREPSPPAERPAAPLDPASAAARARVVVVGAGPAGLFAALTLVDAGVTGVTVLERGQPVETRGKDIGRLIHRRELLKDSNFCYGEGGAGTWSDGKLTTRIGRNSDAVRLVLERLVAHGAPARILVDGKPHLGTDRLVLILRDARAALIRAGVEFRWGVRVQALALADGRCTGVVLAGSEETVHADATVLAVGHSARELVTQMSAAGVRLTAKPFAVGFRIEHPQEMINAARLGAYAGAVDDGALPAADYRLTWQPPPRAPAEPGAGAADGDGGAAAAVVGDAFSFCMCPGGQIVPTSTDSGHLCVNGMSFSRRQSRWANSAVVSQVTDAILEPFVAEHGALAGLAFQEAIEREAARLGGGDLVAPVQLAADFLAGRPTDPAALPPSSYRLGVRAARLDLIYPEALTASLRAALRSWERQLPGFASDPRALLHGVETRTSCPVQIARDRSTLESVELRGVYPTGEGAGWAGGIVSAAVDGVRVGRALALALGVPEGSLTGLAAASEPEAAAAESPRAGGAGAGAGAPSGARARNSKLADASRRGGRAPRAAPAGGQRKAAVRQGARGA
jgi:uncharacterized FAD-dependent dehydrogenase